MGIKGKNMEEYGGELEVDKNVNIRNINISSCCMGEGGIR